MKSTWGINVKKLEGAPGRWLLDVRIRRQGWPVRKQETFSGPYSQAVERFLQLKRQVKDQNYEPPTKAVDTFADVLAHYKSKRSLSVKEESKFNVLLKELGPIRIVELAPKMEEWIQHLRCQSSKKTGKPLANPSINRYIAMAKAAMNAALDSELIEKNPITKSRFAMLKETPRDRVLTDAQIKKLFGAIRAVAPYLEPIVNFALVIPCRKSELVNMRKEDLDLQGMAIRVQSGTTKNGQGIWKPIPPFMKPYFQSIPTECPYLFYRVQKKTFIPLGDFKVAWKNCLQLAGISNFRFHDTRHISATNLLNNGTPEQVVLQAAGWKTNMLRTYYHRAGKEVFKLIKFNSQDQEVPTFQRAG